MKKFLVVLIALLFAGSAFAQDAAPKGPEFKYGVWANAMGLTINNAAKDKYQDASHIRVRPTFTMGVENVSVVTGFEINQFFGKNGTEATYADPDGDQFAVQVKWVFINVKDFIIPGLSAKAGLAPYVYSVGYNNDMPQFNLVYDAGLAKLDLAFVKAEENETVEETSTTKDKDDIAMYSAKLPITAGMVTITPAVLFAKGEKDHSAVDLSTLTTNDEIVNAIGIQGEFTKTMPSIALDVNAGAFTFKADFVYIMGENKSYDVDYKAYAGYLNAGFKASDALSVNIFGLYATGEGDKEDELNSFNAASGDEVEVGPMFIINDGAYITQTGLVGADEFDKSNSGIMSCGLIVNFKADKFSALAQVAYAKTASDELVKDTAIGTEFDLRLSYEVGPKTSFWVEGAYLKAGDYVEAVNDGDCQDPMYYAAGIVTSI